MRPDNVEVRTAEHTSGGHGDAALAVSTGARKPARGNLEEGGVAPTRRPGLDPRTKIVLVVLCSAVVMGSGGLRFVPAVLVLGTTLAVWERSWVRAVGLPAVAVALWVLGWVLPLWWPNLLTATTAIACAYLIRFAAAIGLGMHLIATTSPTLLAAGLRAWRVPRAVSVTLAVMLRVFPVVASESAAVLDAMRLRGLVGARGLARHPVLGIERFTVPMIAASLRATEDLSAATILRGLGSHRRPTAMVPPRFGVPDLILAVAVAILAAAAVWMPQVLA
ncbi:MAG: energy-coupling factor transporter transmembrane component T [Brevibacterium aurantiacum]|uniref:Cobalt transporter n=1 Tax=Brevibacterium aurantiacum TaxID=273384 RepID=A0A2H1JZF0_BREAU|nr:energy-coupling factor transporter transmembrane component T [Brevibacterium aurantiacum]PCC46267.1 cobalt transporter [Brevibacterium aurantiacum]RCS96676.1 energy-coupling factor transporter transmembrane protein EcfT [Brevibacterium aurantiacum]TGD37159.1 energy-coupling factor transporter transmembrane protein EcfT [Brevibacterium aurantiacum]SMX80493.1 energy-coupling factor transport system permease protein [Brevibacterium aurantiacum]SMX92861.1 energy-coupling factor transport system